MDSNKIISKEEADKLSRKEKEEVLNDRGVFFAKEDTDDYLVNNILYSNNCRIG